MEDTAHTAELIVSATMQCRGEFVLGLRLTLQVTTVPPLPSLTRDIVTSKDKGIILIGIDLHSQLM